jgi:lysophospholipase L1-like esterase
VKLRALPRTRSVSYLRWILVALLVLTSMAGCGEEQSTGEEEQTTTATTTMTNSLDYVAFGDSLATGYGATRGYVYRYAALLGADTGKKVSVENLGVNGLTSGQLRAVIENDQEATDAIERSEIITINVGANDLLQARWQYKIGYCGGVDNQDCLRQTVADFRANWDAILAYVVTIRSLDSTIIRVADFYNPFVNLDGATVSWPINGANDSMVFEKYLEQVNEHIAKSADSYGIPHTRIHEAFNGPDGSEDPNDNGYISSDGIHPSDNGHALVALQLRELGYEPLQR